MVCFIEDYVFCKKTDEQSKRKAIRKFNQMRKNTHEMNFYKKFKKTLDKVFFRVYNQLAFEYHKQL